MLNKTKKIMSQALNVILILLLLVMAFLVITSKASNGSPSVMGYQLKSVLSGSMEPTFKTGSIIAITQDIDSEQLVADDVITFKIDEQNLVTHRIVEVIKQNDTVVYVTKGDNNDAVDSAHVLPQNIVGKYTGFTVPYAGYLINATNSKLGLVLILIVPGVLLLIYALMTIWQAITYLERKPEAPTEQA